MSLVSPFDQKTDSPGAGRAGFIFFGWYIVAAGVLIQALGYGGRYCFSVFFPTLIAEFDWPRDLTASIYSTHLLCYGLTATVAGDLVDRIGPRKTMLTGTGLFFLGLILSHWASRPWHFYLSFGLLAGIGLCLLGAVPLTVIIRNWFERRRGAAMSVLFLGSGVAYAFFPAVSWLIDHLGWRAAFLVEGVVIAGVLGPLISWFMVYHPSHRGLVRDGLTEQSQGSPILVREARRVLDQAWAAREWTLADAIRTGRFWLLCLMAFCTWGVSQNLLTTHQIAFAMDVGYSRLYASAVISLNGWFFSVGCLFGMISDRIGREPTMTIGASLAVSGIVVLTLIQDATQPWMLYYYAVSTGLGFGLCAPTIAATITDLFQGPRVGSTVGFVWFCFALGGTVGPWLGGWLFELAGNYLVAFTVAGLTYVLGCFAVWLAGPRKVRLVPGRVKG